MRKRILLASLGFGLVLSLTLNGYQIRKIRSLQRPLDRCIEFLRRGAGDHALAANPVAVPIEVRNLAGRGVSLDIPRNGKTTVLYIFSPGCIWCKRNSGNMKALMDGAGKSFEFIPISLASEGVREYISEHGLRGEVYVEPSEASRNAYGLGGTPQTIVVGPDGRIARNWKGAYAPKLSAEVASVLGVRLPGLLK
jgi:hypothetical protein